MRRAAYLPTRHELAEQRRQVAARTKFRLLDSTFHSRLCDVFMVGQVLAEVKGRQRELWLVAFSVDQANKSLRAHLAGAEPMLLEWGVPLDQLQRRLDPADRAYSYDTLHYPEPEMELADYESGCAMYAMPDGGWLVRCYLDRDIECHPSRRQAKLAARRMDRRRQALLAAERAAALDAERAAAAPDAHTVAIGARAHQLGLTAPAMVLPDS